MKAGDILICVNDFYQGKHILYEKNHRYKLMRYYTRDGVQFYDIETIDSIDDYYIQLTKNDLRDFINIRENRERILKRILNEYEK
jgi:hypothetical protein